ncbi:protein disulfide isomerase pTAC5, chloroplastic [Impatiens glandulifera]|uniref:protein disulfide isomerase pTAC5, chloroplastic n=1 Tax=Impatiens glandulifera TaxID=253017 RepID=UPI001FB155B8|nr:protein disulfide isomerase pTAC5, chloroplastic [Impatiens glandulifera]
MASSSLPLSFRLPLSRRHHLDFTFTPFSLTTHPPSRSLINPHLCFSISPSTSSNHDSEESRWIREEQRWLREEQRWLREQSRWNSERESLLREISSLKLRIHELETRGSLLGPSASSSEAMANIASLLQVLKKEVDLGNANLIAERGTSVVPIVLEAKSSESVEVVKEVVTVSQKDEKKTKKRETLRIGSEGVDVQFLQEALQRLGFYSGEEDVEYSSFSSGTELAVKTWQASVGIPEDGIMTSELQERLFAPQKEETDPKVNNLIPLKKEAINGAVNASATEIDLSQHRVFLLGENRWEEPSRLTERNKKSGQTKIKDSTTCIQCKGVGSMLCSECDGTGEPNLEPQFTEWIEEGAKCPYCEGSGFTVCDLCEGKTTG